MRDEEQSDALHALLLREVGAQGEHTIVTAGHTRHFAGSGVQRGLGAPGECDATAFRSQCFRTGQAESATRTGDDRHFVCESEIHWQCII